MDTNKKKATQSPTHEPLPSHLDPDPIGGVSTVMKMWRKLDELKKEQENPEQE